MKAAVRRAWVLALALAASSCGGVPRVRYYTVDIPHASPASAPVVNRHLTVQRFRADNPLADDRILYRENPNELNFYEYHRWSSPPRDLVTDYFVHRLKDSGAYAGVASYKDGLSADYVLQGRLHRFEEVDRGKEVSVLVAMELELLDAKTRASVWRGEAECTRPLATRDLWGVVGGIHGCLDETASSLLTSMQKRLEKAGN